MTCRKLVVRWDFIGKGGKLASREDGKGGLVLTFLLDLADSLFPAKSLSSFRLRDIANVRVNKTTKIEGNYRIIM